MQRSAVERRGFGAWAFVAMSIVGVSIVGGAFGACQCTTPPQKPPAAGCVLDADCGAGKLCQEGACIASPVDGGVVVGEGEGEGEGADAGVQLGILTVLPDTSVEFGAERIGVPVQRNITLKNTGPVSLTILQIVVDNNSAGTFASDPTGFLNQELAPGDSVGVLLTHTPNDGIPDDANLKVIHTGEGGIATVHLHAEFKGTPVLSVTTDASVLAPDTFALDLGQVPVGATQAVDVLVRNRGANDSLLTVTNVTMTPAVGPFQATHADVSTALLSSFAGFCPNGANDCPTPASDTCTGGVCFDSSGALVDAFVVHVSFAPTQAGPQQATLTLAYTGDGGAQLQQDIALTAAGTSGSILITPGSVTFANAFVGRTNTQQMTISNAGDANISVDSIALDSGAAWTIAGVPALPQVLVPSGSINVSVSILANAEGNFADTLRVTAGSDVATAALSATERLAPSAIVPASLPFGNVYVGTTATQNLVVKNGGPGELHVTGLFVTGPGSSHYAVTVPPLPAQVDPLVNPGDASPNLSVAVAYTAGSVPTGAVDQAVLHVDTDDPDNLQGFDVALSGMAIQPVIALVQSALDFGTINIGTSSTKTIEVRNTGFGPLVITSLALNPSGDYTAAPESALPATLVLGGPSLFVDVTFTAHSPGPSGATLAFASNDLANPSASASLVGAGKTCDPLAGTTFVQNGNQCTYACAAGFVDLNGDLNTPTSDGCEYQCTPTGGVDDPEASAPFVDQNCDGIDGTIANAIFVSPSGNDSNAGTPTAPLRSIDTAVARAALGGLDVYVAGGSYALSSTLQLADGVSIFGGYSSTDWSRSDADVAVIQVANPTAANANGVDNVTLDRVELVAASATAGSSYGLFATSSSITVRNATITAGRGANGASGTSGGASRAADGPTGNPGGPGTEHSHGVLGVGCDFNPLPSGGAGVDNPQCTGHRGGDGGAPNVGNNTGFDGADGSGGGTKGKGTPAKRNNTDWNGFCGGQANQICGHDGNSGAGGNDGAKGSGTFTASGWTVTNGANGTSGTAGDGGGGGGGGGGGDVDCDSSGGGGGGGGAGGCGGLRGTGGGSGGGSVAIFAFNSVITVTGSTLQTGGGGNGGNGGAGQAGGHGGLGGGRTPGSTTDFSGNDYGGSSEQDDGSNGARGGKGGDGGDGGAGGGGAGGPSIGIVSLGGSSLTQTGNTFTLGTAGTGGSSPGNAGSNGQRANTLPLP